MPKGRRLHCGFCRARSRLIETSQLAMSSFETFVAEVSEMQAYILQLGAMPSMSDRIEESRSAHSTTVLTKIASMPSMTLVEATQLSSLVDTGPWTVPLRISINPFYVFLFAFVSNLLFWDDVFLYMSH